MAKNSSTYRRECAAELTAALRQLSHDVRAQVLESGTKAAIRPILTAAKRFAKRSERTGALRESLTTKVKVYAANGKAVGLVGPDRNYYRRGKRVSKNVASFVGADRPANYAHLIEFGHMAVKPRKGTSLRKKTAELGKKSWVPPKPFIRPAVLTTLAQQSAEFQKGIEKEFMRAVRRASGKST